MSSFFLAVVEGKCSCRVTLICDQTKRNWMSEAFQKKRLETERDTKSETMSLSAQVKFNNRFQLLIHCCLVGCRPLKRPPENPAEDPGENPAKNPPPLPPPPPPPPPVRVDWPSDCCNEVVFSSFSSLRAIRPTLHTSFTKGFETNGRDAPAKRPDAI